MEKLLTSYLYNFKNCPLPTVGSLVLQTGTASSQQSEKKILAPQPHVQFVSKEINADGLLQFIADSKNIEVSAASDQLSRYCDSLLEMQPYEEIKLDSAGSFYLADDGELSFKYTVLPASFFPAVNAERVIHPDVSHEMLVGDTQTNTATMAELLDTRQDTRRPKWIWAAVGLGLAAVLALVIYSLNRTGNNAFGNSSGINVTEAPATYQPSSK